MAMMTTECLYFGKSECIGRYIITHCIINDTYQIEANYYKSALVKTDQDRTQIPPPRFRFDNSVIIFQQKRGWYSCLIHAKSAHLHSNNK